MEDALMLLAAKFLQTVKLSSSFLPPLPFQASSGTALSAAFISIIIIFTFALSPSFVFPPPHPS
jgi:hypothetical protein